MKLLWAVLGNALDVLPHFRGKAMGRLQNEGHFIPCLISVKRFSTTSVVNDFKLTTSRSDVEISRSVEQILSEFVLSI